MPAGRHGDGLIYFDAAATAPVRREVLERMWPYLTGEFGNASSRHELGMRAAEALKRARASLAALLHCRASEIIFTAGGTEADNLAVKGIALAGQTATSSRRILTTAIEHEAVLASCDYLRRLHGFEIVFTPLDRFGRVIAEDFEAELRKGAALASIMYGNNEIGTLQPIADLARLAQRHGVPFHTDAVQVVGALPVDLEVLGVDALSVSGHKLGAPKGLGALVLRGRVALEPLLHGGGQERGRRSGTENVAGAVGLAAALELASLALPERAAHITTLRDRLIAGVLAAVPDAILTGHPTERLPNNASFCFPGTSGESMLLQLEEQGVLCSSGSACAAGRDEPSHVLLALGLNPDLALTAVRFSLGTGTTEEEIDAAIAAVQASRSALQR